MFNLNKTNMKELSIEQKAQRYDEISKEVKDFFDGKLMMYSDVEQTLNYLFPELGESDDEKIRKWLLDTITQIPNDSIEWDVIEKAKVLSWLEKQGQEPKKVSIWKHWKNGIAGNGDGKPIYLIKNGYTYSLSSCLSFECDYIELSDLDNLLLEKQGGKKPFTIDIDKMVEKYAMTRQGDFGMPVNCQVKAYRQGINDVLRLALNLEKQGEHKPAKKIEPKFQHGQWIVWQNKCYKVNYNGCGYELVDQNGLSTSLEYGTIDENAHIWDITKDAKAGDVLYSLDSKQPFIFKHRKPNEQAEAYCGLNIYGKFFVWGTKDCVITLSNYIPATKEQRELLFKKMKEEGYQWDADTKKLIKTTTPIPKFKFGDIIKHKPTGVINSIKYVCSDYYVLDNNQALFFESQDMWELIASKVKPTLEEKVSILVDEIIDLKERVKSLELQVIKQCSDKIRLDSLESKMIMIEMKLSALEYGSTPLTLIQNPFLYSGKVTCDDAQCYKSKSASDTFETPDKAGDNVTLEEMRNECKG